MFDPPAYAMEFILSIAVIMIWFVAMVLTFMTYLGFDVRSRGFECNGFVAATLPLLGISIRDYYEKRGEHPVVDEELASKARAFWILTRISFVVLIAIIVIVIVL